MPDEPQERARDRGWREREAARERDREESRRYDAFEARLRELEEEVTTLREWRRNHDDWAKERSAELCRAETNLENVEKQIHSMVWSSKVLLAVAAALGGLLTWVLDRFVTKKS